MLKMLRRNLLLLGLLLMIWSSGSTSQESGTKNVGPMKLSGIHLYQAIEELKKADIPYTLQLKGISSDTAFMVPAYKEGAYEPSSGLLPNGKVLTLYFKAPVDMLEVRGWADPDYDRLKRQNKELEQELDKKNKEIEQLKTKSIIVGGNPRLELPFSMVIASYIFLVICLFYVLKTILWSGLGSQEIRVPEKVESSPSTLFARSKTEFDASGLAKRVSILENLNPEITSNEKLSSHALRELDQRAQQIQENIEETIQSKISSSLETSSFAMRLSMVDAFNHALLSRDRGKQKLFKSMYGAKLAVPEGEAAEKGYMASPGGQYLLTEQPWGSFLVIEESNKTYVLPDFDIDILSRFVSSAFDMRLSESPGPNKWYLVHGAEAESLHAGSWRLTEKGEIGGRPPLEERTDWGMQFSKELAEIRAEIDSLRSRIGETVRETSAGDSKKNMSSEPDVGLGRPEPIRGIRDIDVQPPELEIIQEEAVKRVEERIVDKGLDIKETLQEPSRSAIKPGEAERKFQEHVPISQREEIDLQVPPEAGGPGIQMELIRQQPGEILLNGRNMPLNLETVTFNDNLDADRLKQEEFITRKVETKVVTNREGDDIIFRRNEHGDVFLVKSKELPSGQFSVLPAFSANPDQLGASFYVGGSREKDRWTVREPGRCIRVSEDTWKLLSKGEIEFS